MAVTQYIGSRYVPLFADPIEWSSSNTYEPLTIVLHEGNSYTSKQAVPKDIDISNEAFWALTGNYNAQVEAYRRETAAAQATAEGAQADIDTILPKAAFANTTIKQYVDDGYDELEQAVQRTYDLIEGKTLGLIETNYLMRAYLPPYTYKNVQGMCLLDDTVALVAISDSTTTNNCTIMKVNLMTGEIIQNVTRQFGHCNDMAFNPTTNKVYVCPNNDYTGDETVGVHYIYVVNPLTLNIEQTIDLGFRAQSICYDKTNERMFIIGVEYLEETFTLYSFDPLTSATHAIRTFTTTDMRNAFTYLYHNIGGWQGISAYDGIVSFVLSGETVSYILQIDESNGDFIKIINVAPDCFIYGIPEVEGIDYFSNGSVLLWSKGRVHGKNLFGVLSLLNMQSNTVFTSTYNSAILQSQQSANCDSSQGYNYSLIQFGSTSKPFGTFLEAYALQELNGCARINIVNTVDITSDMLPGMSNTDLYIIGATDNAKLRFEGRFLNNGNIFINGKNNSNPITLELATNGYDFDNYGKILMQNCIWRWDASKTGGYVIRNFGLLQLKNVSTANVPETTQGMVQNAHVGLTSVDGVTGITVREGGTLVTTL